MPRKKYNKTPSTYAQQIKLLKSRGLSVPDQKKALRYFQQISYYRLSAYFLPYQSVKDNFDTGTEFDLILNTYRFDRELRILVFDCIERIEIAIRAQITHILAHNYNNSHWQDIPAVFKAPYKNPRGELVNHFADLQRIIKNNCSATNPEVFIKHYISNYYTPVNPPSWMCMELLTIGDLSRLYMGLKRNSDKQQIADFFGLHHKVFTSWLHTLTYVRNVCAHHARLWNRSFSIKPEIVLSPSKKWVSSAFKNNQRTFYFLCILKYLLIAANPNNHLTVKLDKLLSKYAGIPVQYIGIPVDAAGNMLNWKEEPLWK